MTRLCWWSMMTGWLMAAAVAAGQSPPRLSPAAFSIPAGEPIRLRLSEPAWPATSWVFVRGEGTQENMDSPPAADAAGQVALPAPGPGAAMVGFDFEPVTVAMPAGPLREFIAARAAPAMALDPAKTEFRVRWTRSAKTLVRVGGAAGPSPTVVGKAGQKVEIRPLMDPTVGRVGADIPLRTFVDGGKLAGARVLATPDATGKTVELRTNDEGIGLLRLTHPGAWTLEFSHLAPSAEADLAIASATLTFEVPAPPAPPAGAPK